MNFIEESNKYITRGLIYLICWFLVAPIALIFTGAAMLGVLGAFLGLAASIGLGLWGYHAYLEWNGRKLMGDYYKG